MKNQTTTFAASTGYSRKGYHFSALQSMAWVYVSKVALPLIFAFTGSLVFQHQVAAQVCNQIEDFASAITIGPSQAPGVWYVDRYAPNGFFSPSGDLGGTTLKHSINVADGAVNRAPAFQGAFYNTQGRKYDLPAMTRTMQIDLYVPTAWGTSNKREAGLWGTAIDIANAVSGYPILEFTSDGGIPRFRCYETGTGLWVDLGLPTGFVYNAWYTLEIELLNNSEFLYTVGNLQFTTTSGSGDASVAISNVILQGYNYDPTFPLDPTNPGVTYDIYWDNYITNLYPIRNTSLGLDYCTLQAAINAASPGDNIIFLGNHFEGLVIVNKTLSINGNGFTLTSTSPTYGINPAATGISIQDLTLQDAGTYGIQTDCGADFLLMTNVTVNSSGNTGISIYGSDNCTLNNITSTNNGGNGVNVTNCDNTTITGITTSGNTFGSFGAGIGLFTSGTYCLPAGLSGFTLGGTVSIAETPKVYSQKSAAADPLTGVSGATIDWAVGVGALDRSYWPDKLTAYAVADGLFEPPYNYPNSLIYVADVVTEHFYVDDDPNGDASPPMLIQTAVTYEAPGKTIFLESGTFNERVTLDKSLTLDGDGAGASILDGTGLAGNGNGITINPGITNVTIKDLTVRDYAGASGNANAGIYAIGGNNNLSVTDVDLADNVGGSGFYANGPIDNVLLNNVDAHGHTISARGIVIWNGHKSNITITNCEVYNNNCCGIELQDGSASGVTMTNNNVHDNWDNGIGIVGLDGTTSNNLVNANVVTNNGRFGIEIKNPNGNGTNTVISNNNVTQSASFVSLRPSEVRDIAGIAVFRRGLTGSNVDVPNGVRVINNTVSGFIQDNGASASEGFGIVIEGINHTVTGNIVSSNDVGLQQQAGHTPYPGDGDQSNLPDTYFGRGNSPMTCGNTVTPNNLTNPINTRNVGVGAGLVINTNTSENFCSIQSAIDDANTVASHTISVTAGTYNEDVLINKDLTLQGAGIDVTTVSGPIGGGSATFQVGASGVTIDGFTITRDGNNTTDWNNPSLNIPGIAIQGQTVNAEIRNNKIIGNRTGIDINNSNSNNIHNNIITFNRTGAIFRNQTDNTLFNENFVTDNWTVGIVFLDASGGTNVPVQQALNCSFNDNDMSGNWYGQIVDRQTGGALPLPGANAKDFECNWYGSVTPWVSTANSSEPGYAAQIPVAYGGSAVPPGGQPDILGPASANFDYINYLLDGTDDLPLVAGFQPVSGACTGMPVVVTSTVLSNQTCSGLGSIQVTFSGGVGPYDIAWTGGGSAVMVTSPYTITGLTAGAYIITVTDDNGTTGTSSSTVLYQPVTNTTQMLSYTTIQAAINAANPNDVITVCAGTYDEQVSVNKSLNIQGANTGIAGNGVRGPESIVDGNNAAHAGFVITAPNVTIDGFKVQNCGNTIYESGIYTNSTGTMIRNNILFNNEKGVYASNTGPSTVQFNLFDGNNRIGMAAPAISLYSFTSNGLSVLNNEFKNQNSNAAAIFDAGASHQNLIFNSNYLHNNDPGSSCVYVANCINPEFGYNHITNGRRGFKIAGGNNTVNIHNNIITNTVQADIMVNTDWGANTAVQAHWNSLTGTITILNEDVTVVDATCNWFGSTVPATIDASITETNPNTVNYAPWLTSGTDTDLGTIGFQTTESCSSCNVMVSASYSDIYCGSSTEGIDITATGGTGVYTYVWTGAGVIPTAEDQTGLSAGTYNVTVTDANGCTATTSVTILYLPVTNTTDMPDTYYTTIQAAIDAAAPNDILEVCAGTYAEHVIVNKALDIRGPNYGISGASMSRVTEALIVPEATLMPGDPWTEVVYINSNNVSFDGFKISGDNPLLSGYAYAGMDLDKGQCVYSEGNNVQFRNNIVEKATTMGFFAGGAQVAPHYADLVVTDNKFENIHDINQLGYGFAMYIQATTGLISNNTVENCRTGLQVQPYDVISAITPVVTGNTFNVWRSGIWYNYAENGATAWNINGNTVNAINPPVTPLGPVRWQGIAAETMRVTSNGGTISGNTVNGNSLNNPLYWWTTIGLHYAGAASVSTAVVFTGNTVSGVNYGMVHDAPADITFTGNNLTAATQAISIQRQYSSAGVIQPTGGLNNINATGGNTINGVTTGSATLPQLYAIEDAINHKVDSCIFGLVTVIPNQLYVTTNSSSIQCGIDAASTGWIVNIKGGTYQGNVDAVAGGDDLAFAPGSSPGCVVIGGDLTLNGGDDLTIEINGTTPCTGHDQFTVNGIVTLGGANLDATLGYAPVNGDQIVIIDNDGGDAIIGQFAQGGSVILGGNYFLINYAGGSGNDVVLTMCAGVQNTTTLEVFCTIQEGIDDPQTLDGHTLTIAAGTYNERVTLTKRLTLDGAGAGLTILDGTGLAGNGNGITINTGIINVTIKDLTVRDYAGASGNANAGIYGIGGNNNLTVTDVDLADNVGGSGFYANGPIDNVLLNNVDAHGHTIGARGIVIWNGHKSNITITNCEVYNNNCCGIELQDGSGSGINVSNNNVHDNWDNGIGIVGLDGTTANNLVNANTVTNNGRFGIEIKNPNGNGTNTVISNNNVTQSASFVSLRPSEVRDIAGIAVFRRGLTGSNVDVPNGVQVINNMVSGYIQDNGASVSEGFGIVIEGTNHTATGNTINNNDIGLQQQAGHTPYPGDGDQNNIADTYFGRGNSPMTCANTIAPNNYAGNGANTRNVVVGGGLVTNTNTSETFCSIQSAINDANTVNGHTLSISDGTYNENVTINKELTLTGGGNGSNPATNTVLTPASSCSGVGFTISAANVTIQNMYVTNYQDAVLLNGVASPIINNMALVDYCRYGVSFGGNNSSVQILQTNIQRTSILANTVGIRVGTANAVNGLLINNSSITGNALQGIVVFQDAVPVAFDNITITNSTISNNLQKGMYFEKLNNALFSNLTMANNGTDPTYGFNNGIDINLKYGNYSNITIEDCDITNSGYVGGMPPIDPQNAAAIAIKARDDSPSYNSNPATLTSVTITNNRISGPQNGIRFGEFGKINNTPTNVLVEGNDLSFPFANKAIVRRTNADVNMLCNWHGSTSLPVILATFAEAGTGSTILSSINLDGVDVSGNAGFQPNPLQCGCPSGNLVTNTNTPETFCTIQAAIDDPDTQTGDVLEVGPGTYIENVIVDKSIIIRGPNYLIDPCSVTPRMAEAIVVPVTSAISSGEIFHVAADNVTISGFTIDGNNTALTSGYLGTNGADIDAAEGITVYETGIDGLTATNNIIQNLSYFGVTLYDYPAGVPSSGHSIANNKFQHLGTYAAGSGIAFWGGGVLLYNNQYAAVTDNCMENVRLGVQTGNFSQANPGAPAYQVISGNTMSVRKRGIFHNLAYGTASSYTLSGNSITGVVDGNETTWDGILLSSLSVPSTSSNNIINGTGITNPSEGYEVWNVKSTTPANISGGSVSATTIGLSLNNYEGYNSDAGDGAHATVSNLAITPVASGTGIRLHDNPLSSNANVQLTMGAGVTVSGGTTGLRVENASASIVGGTLNNLSFTGTTGQYIDLVNNSGDLNATAVTFDGPNGMGASLLELFAIENKINHEIDNNALGFVTVKASNAYVTDIPALSATAINNDYTRLRNAVELVSNSWSINLNGSFDWTETNAAASWALGNDDTNATGDDYGILVPANLNGITFTAPLGLTTASIQGPGDVPTVNLEGVLYCDGAGDNQNWTISNIEFLEFDMPISMFNGAGGVDAYQGTTITGNKFDIATDLNTVAAPSDPNQNIGIHYSFGANQTISNNIFNIPGDGVSNGVNYSTTVVMQSNTSGGSVYDGLLITGNTINILYAQDAMNPQVVLGIWENGHAHTSNITVSNNQFNNLAVLNNPLLNLQRAFRVTSHSGAGSTVTYSGNTAQGANIGFQWIAASNFTAEMPVSMTGNMLHGNNIGILLQSNGKVLLTNNDFDAVIDNNRDLQIQPGSVVTTGGGNQWSGEEYYVENLSSTSLDITGEMFDQANNFRRTDRIYDALDNPTVGLVRFDGNQLYVSAPATGLSDETIPNAISAAAALGDKINIESGVYSSGLDASAKEITVIPGASPGCVTLGANMLLTGGDQLDIELNGTVACTGHDQFIVNGTVTLGGANLNIILGYVPTNLDEYIIIANDLADPVSGTFVQGSSIVVGPYTFVINYAGGDGNDVVLEMCTGQTTITTPTLVVQNTPVLPASVPDVGGGATYVWSITNGTITGGQGTSSINYTSGMPGTLTIYVTVTDANGCVSTDSQVVTVIAVGPSSMVWVLDNGDNDGSCPDATNCCLDIICYDLVYTPAVSGNLTTYTTGFVSNCLGPIYPPPIALDGFMMPLNKSCIMTDNSNEIDDCANTNSYLFNSSGQSGNVPVVAGVAKTIHKVCFQISAGETINLVEDVPTDLTASIDLLDINNMVIGQYTDFPTFTPAAITKPLPVIPALGALTVSCPAEAVLPTPPTVLDYCGNPVPATLLTTVDNPMPVICEGTRTYNFNYTDCAGITYPWSFTYTIEREDFTVPVGGGSTVDCAADATSVTVIVPTVLSECGETLTPTGPVTNEFLTDTYAGCEGTISYTWTYTDCELNSHTWTYTYLIERQDFSVPVGAGSTVDCAADAVSGTVTVPTVLSDCGEPLTPTGPVTNAFLTDTYAGCEGTISYTWTYTDCELNSHTWTYTYLIERQDFSVPVGAGSTVDCAADATSGTVTVPTVLSDCGEPITPTGPVTNAFLTDTYAGCEGTISYTWTFTDCELNSHTWTYTYMIERQDFSVPVGGSSTVNCPADASSGAVILPTVLSDCGETLSPTGPVTNAFATDTYDGCEGTISYTWTYADCEVNSHTWTYTYTVERLPFNNPVDQGSTVFCPLNTDTPPTPPAVVDNCGNTLTPSVPAISPIPGCDGTRTYTYTYTDCEGNTQDWVYTYTVDCDPVTLKVLLEGPYNAGTNLMDADLNIHHLLPGQDKLLSPDMTIQLAAPFTPFGQPYNTAPWNYNGNTGLNFGDASSPSPPPGVIVPYPLTVVDWVLVTVRKNGILPAHNLWTCAGWVHTNGNVTFPESCGALSLNGADDYYVMVQHRNHLGVLTPMPALEPCSGYVINWDFTASNSYQPTFRSGQKQVEPGTWAMHAANGEQITSIPAISSPDRTTWRLLQGVLGYSIGDYDMSNAVTSPDETVWKNNQNKTSGIIFY